MYGESMERWWPQQAPFRYHPTNGLGSIRQENYHCACEFMMDPGDFRNPTPSETA